MRSSGRSPIFVFDEPIVENSGHSNSSSREVRVVVETFTDFNTGRGVDVTSDQGVNVILSTNMESVFDFSVARIE